MDNFLPDQRNDQIFEKKQELTKRIKDVEVKTEIKVINSEQEKVVQKLKTLLNFFENVQIKNEDSLDYVKKPLDDLLSSLKYLPVHQGPCFNDLPVELKTDILSYVCDSGAFVVASVCQQWKAILETRLLDLPYISIGKCCSNSVSCRYTHEIRRYDTNDEDPSCEKVSCFMPEEILKASIALGMEIPMEICYPVDHIDPKLLVEGLNICDFKINSGCVCREDARGRINDEPLLSEVQIEQLVEAMEKGSEIKSVEIKGLDMTHMDQDRLIDCLFKVEKLTLAEGNFSDWIEHWSDPDPILDFKLFVEKLLKSSSNIGLSYLHLEYIHYYEDLTVDFANALCKVKCVELGQRFPLLTSTILQLIKNILRRPIRMKSLYVYKNFNWRSLITADDLKKMLQKMKGVRLWGSFTEEQVEAATSIPGVEAIETTINKNVFTSVKICKGRMRADRWGFAGP